MTSDRTYQLIVIGGSWGGMQAIINILKDIPKCCSIPIIVVLHRLKDVQSELDELLSRKTGLSVKEIDEKEPIEPGKVYLAPADYHVLIESEKTFSLDFSSPENFSRPSIDVLFESAALVYKDSLIGILLTGASADGSKGLKKIADYGGVTIVQDPSEAEVATMPNAALKIMQPSAIWKLNEIRAFIKTLG